MSRWVIDSDHSVAAFAVRHMMVANVRGQFNKISGEINFERENPEKSRVEIKIDTAGICTGIKKRDDHLRSVDFFDAAKYPLITFVSKKVEYAADNLILIAGELTIKDKTKSINLKVSSEGPVKSPFGETSKGFSALFTVNREDFGVMWNMPLDGGGFMVGKDVQIYLDIEADLAEKVS